MIHIDNIVKDYITSKNTDYAIMIDGQWGAGKSFYWKHTLAPMIAGTEIPDKSDCYKPVKVSLFGIQSVDDLKLEIYSALYLDDYRDGKDKQKKYIKDGLLVGGGILKVVADKLGISVEKKLAANLLSLSGIDLSTRVLCFDDLERLDEDIMKEVLGYINTLVEEKHLKVVLICYNDQCKSSDYDSYKEKLVRYTCKLKADIPAVIESLMEGKDENFRQFILVNKEWISSVYQKAECDNLRTLKFNMDVMERIYPDVTSNMGKPEWKVPGYVLLLTMTYSIESKVKAENQLIEHLLQLSQSWANQISYMDSLTTNRRFSDEEPKEITDPKELYLRKARSMYFQNTYVYGSSKALLDYILTGNFNQERFIVEIKAMAEEASRIHYTDEQKLMSKLGDFWDIDDDDLAKAIAEVLDGTFARKYPMAYYPNYFLRLQRLQEFGFADTGHSIVELKQIFSGAINECSKTGYNEQLNGIYDHTDNATPEFRELAKQVYDLNYAQRNESMSNEFKEAMLNLESNVDLHAFYNLPVNLYANINATDFFQSFLKCHNTRKRDVLKFFEERYDFVEHRNLDAVFIANISTILEEHLNSKDTLPSPSKKYCEHLLKKITFQS